MGDLAAESGSFPDCREMFQNVCRPLMEGIRTDIKGSIAELREEMRISNDAQSAEVSEVHKRLDGVIDNHIIPMSQKINDGLIARMDRMSHRLWWIIGSFLTVVVALMSLFAVLALRAG